MDSELKRDLGMGVIVAIIILSIAGSESGERMRRYDG